MDYSHLNLSVEDYIATLTLNRPDRGNAINELLVNELLAALERIAGDNQVRVMILTGAGRAFCVGADLTGDEKSEQMFQKRDTEEIRKGIRHLQMVTRQIINGSSRIDFQWSTFTSPLRLKLMPLRNELLAGGYMDLSQG